jgi:hypothetical protein
MTTRLIACIGVCLFAVAIFGKGPVAALNKCPADLTALAKNNAGMYPAMKVASVLSGKTSLAAHGRQEMPIGGLYSGV